MGENRYVHFNCPRQLLEQFDEAIKGRYNSRTEAVLDAMRKLVKELKELEEP